MGFIQGTTIGLTKADTRSLDYGSYKDLRARMLYVSPPQGL